MENEKFKVKIRRVAKISTLFLSLYILLPLYVCVKDFFAGFIDGYHSTENTMEDSILGLLFQIAAVVAGICAIVNSLRLLFAIQKQETAFTNKNGKRIRRIGVMLMVLEPLMLLSKLVSGMELPEIYGITFCAGLLIFNVSLLFDYGAHLQQESDETL